MASYTIEYRSLLTPVEIVTLADGTTTRRSIHSEIDERIGSKMSKSAGANSGNVAFASGSVTYGISTTLSTILGKTVTDVALLFVRVASNSNGACKIIITPAGSVMSTIRDLGDWVLLRPEQLSSDNIAFYGVDVGGDCTIDIAYALFDDVPSGE